MANESIAIQAFEAKLFMNGVEVGFAQTFEATVEKNKYEVPTMGDRWVATKTGRLTGSGTINLLKVSSRFAQQIKAYEKTGIDVYFTLQGVNNDPAATKPGEQRITVYNCNIDSALLFTADAAGEFLVEDVPFTFKGFDINTAHKM